MFPNNGLGYSGIKQPGDSASDFNAHQFLIKSMLGKVRTGTLVKVMTVTNAGDLSPVGFVDILPLVNQIDGAGNTIPHTTIHHCPYFRLQGGTNAVIIDPEFGDIGWAMVADRDISSATANKDQSNPGSRRMFDFSDAVYIGGMLNGNPSQYVQFNASGITITSPNAVTINANSVVIKAASIALQNAGTALKTLLNSSLLTWLNSHVHGNGNGGANTTAPTTAPAASAQTSTVTAE